MSIVTIVLLIIAAAIILGLGFYAGKLVAQVKEQQQQAQLELAQRQADIERHNAYLVDSICLIAKAVTEEQCELSEGAIRICRLLEKVYVEHDTNYPEDYPALHKLDSFLADYPTHEGYKALKRQERMSFDVKRAQQEIALKEAIILECEQLKSFAPAT